MAALRVRSRELECLSRLTTARGGLEYHSVWELGMQFFNFSCANLLSFLVRLRSMIKRYENFDEACLTSALPMSITRVS